VAGLRRSDPLHDDCAAQRQPCSPASQLQPGPQAHAGAAITGLEAAAWQPQVQPAPGQSTHRHEGEVEVKEAFIEIS